MQNQPPQSTNMDWAKTIIEFFIQKNYPNFLKFDNGFAFTSNGKLVKIKLNSETSMWKVIVDDQTNDKFNAIHTFYLAHHLSGTRPNPDPDFFASVDASDSFYEEFAELVRNQILPKLAGLGLYQSGPVDHSGLKVKSLIDTQLEIEMNLDNGVWYITTRRGEKKTSGKMYHFGLSDATLIDAMKY